MTTCAICASPIPDPLDQYGPPHAPACLSCWLLPPIACNHCKEGRVKCDACEGLGEYPCWACPNEPKGEQCQECGGEQMLDCDDCGGGGDYQCPVCRGVHTMAVEDLFKITRPNHVRAFIQTLRSFHGIRPTTTQAVIMSTLAKPVAVYQVIRWTADGIPYSGGVSTDPAEAEAMSGRASGRRAIAEIEICPRPVKIVYGMKLP